MSIHNICFHVEIFLERYQHFLDEKSTLSDTMADVQADLSLHWAHISLPFLHMT